MYIRTLISPFRGVALALGLIALVFVAISVSGKQSEGLSSTEESGPSYGGFVGKKAPGFNLTSLSGGQVSLEDLRGHEVVLNFWATWCAPCRAEMPDLQRVYSERSEEGLVVLAVNLKEDPSQVDKYVRDLGLTFPVALDKDGSVSEKYKVLGLPTSVFIDKQGVVRGVSYGALNQSAIERRIKSMAPKE